MSWVGRVVVSVVRALTGSKNMCVPYYESPGLWNRSSEPLHHLTCHHCLTLCAVYPQPPALPAVTASLMIS